jgi:hypothetical protein
VNYSFIDSFSLFQLSVISDKPKRPPAPNLMFYRDYWTRNPHQLARMPQAVKAAAAEWNILSENEKQVVCTLIITSKLCSNLTNTYAIENFLLFSVWILVDHLIAVLQKYVNQYNTISADYKKMLSDWQARMISEGRGDLVGTAKEKHLVSLSEVVIFVSYL